MPCVKGRAQRRDQLDFRFELLREIERGFRRGEGRRVADMRCGEDRVGRREEGVEVVQEGEVVVEQSRVTCHESTGDTGTTLEEGRIGRCGSCASDYMGWVERLDTAAR